MDTNSPQAGSSGQVALPAHVPDPIRAGAKYLEAVKAYRLDHFKECVVLLNEAADLDNSDNQITDFLQKVNHLIYFLVESRTHFSKRQYISAKKNIHFCKRIVDAIQFPNKHLEGRLELKLSLIAFRSGKTSDSFKHVTKALDLYPTYVNGLLHRAHLHKLNKNWEATIQDLEAKIFKTFKPIFGYGETLLTPDF